MSQRNVEVVQRIYELASANWEAREAGGAIFELFDPEVVLEEQATFPDARAYRGHAGVVQWWTAFYEVYDEIRLEPQKLTAVDDQVLVEIRLWLKSKVGVGLWMDSTHLFRLRDGKVVHVSGYRERADANVELLRRGYETWNREGFGGVRELLHADIEMVLPEGGLNTGTRSGREEVQQFFDSVFDAFEEVRVEPEAFYPKDDLVVVFIRAIVRGKGSGVELSTRPAHVWTVRDARVVRLQVYPERERDRALQEAGLPPGHPDGRSISSIR